MTLGIEREGLAEPLRELSAPGRPVLGTCAGMIMLDRDHLGVLDITTERNAFGRQLRSFEADIELTGVGAVRCMPCSSALPGWRSTAPGRGAGAVDGHPVAIRQGNVIAVAFHPELAGETRLHQLLLANERRASRRRSSVRRGSRSGTRMRGTRARTPAQSNARDAVRAGRRLLVEGAPRRRRADPRSRCATGEPRRKRADADAGGVHDACQDGVVGQRGEAADRVQGQRGQHQPAQLAARERRGAAHARRRSERSPPTGRRHHQLPRDDQVATTSPGPMIDRSTAEIKFCGTATRTVVQDSNHEPVAHRVLGDRPGLDEMQQVIRARPPWSRFPRGGYPRTAVGRPSRR